MEAVLLALLCADRVITEERTKKRSIIGTFNNFFSQNFPVAFPPWFVYLAFTNVDGEHEFTLNIADPENDFTVYSAKAAIATENRSDQIELTIPVVNASFPEPGRYEVRVSFDGRNLGSRYLTVSQATRGGGL